MDLQKDWLKQWALYAPSSVAFNDADSDRAWTYRALYHIAIRVARTLRDDFGIAKGDRVAVLAQNEMEHVPLFFALQRLGAVMVPVNFRLATPEIEHILSDSGAKLLIHQRQYQSTVEALNPVSAPDRRWHFDGPKSLSDLISDFLVNESAFEPSTDDERAMDSLDLADPCLLLYTSGTTGAPKGALITHGMLFWNSINTTLRLNLSQSDVSLSFLPFFHTGGWNVLLTPFVHRGARTVIMRKFDPAQILELCERERVTILFGVPTTMDMMAREPRFAAVDLSSVRYAVVGGEPMPIELIKTWQTKGVPIRQGYGLTEFGPNVFSLGEEDSLRKIGSIGFPNFYIEAKVVGDDGRELGSDQVGELALRGPVCTPGYWRNETATRESIRDGWFFTGDLVRRDSDGYYYVAGRKKDMFISGGENVYPVEVERVLSSHPAIREVAVVGTADEKWGEVGHAFVALNEGASLTLDETLAFCAGKLAKFKIPRHVTFLRDLPKGDSGKILKRKLASAPRSTSPGVSL